MFRGSPLLVYSCLEVPLIFLCWIYWYLVGPFLDYILWSERGRGEVLLRGKWLEGYFLPYSPQEGCGGIWGYMEWEDKNLCRGSPLSGRSFHEVPLVFLR